MRKYKLNAPILIDWVDIQFDTRWMKNELAIKRPDDIDCQNLGFYLKHDKELLWVSHCIGEGERDRTVIPIGCIKKITVMKPR